MPPGIYTRSKEQIERLRSLAKDPKVININKEKKTGKNNPNWKGGTPLDSYGYRTININGKYYKEHIVIWEQAHNMKLPKGYVVHHLNGIKTDNRPENLVAMSRKEHIHQAEPFKKRIAELEERIRELTESIDRNTCDRSSENDT